MSLSASIWGQFWPILATYNLIFEFFDSLLELETQQQSKKFQSLTNTDPAEISTETAKLEIPSFESLASHSKESQSLAPQRPQQKFKKSVKRWEQPFDDEKAIVNKFEDYANELILLAESKRPELDEEIKRLAFAKAQHQSLSNRDQSANSFLAPATKAAVKIAETLNKTGMHKEAYWICNIFGEMSKVLIERNREKYQDVFESLLTIAFYALSDISLSSVNESRTSNDQEVELNALRIRLEKSMQNALDTFFHWKSGRFLRNRQPDEALGERVINETLAHYFDSRLYYLLQHDRPRVKEYVSANMPIVYKASLSEKWIKRREQWEQELTQAGYDDTIRLLKDMGDLISIDELGQLSPAQMQDVQRALNNNNFDRIRSLLTESASEIRSYLYTEAQVRLDYRQPPPVHIQDDRLKERFARVLKWTSTNDPDRLQKALEIAQDTWQKEIANLGLRDWVAFLQAKVGNTPASERELEFIRKKRDAKYNFTTDWNLAVMAYDRKDEATAYQLLVPLLDRELGDEDLVIILLALSLKLDDLKRFLSIIPRTMTLRFHPLAIVIAIDTGDEAQAKEFLADFLRQSGWQLPPVTQRFNQQSELEDVANRAIVEGQVEQLITWLRARINANKAWVPNYLTLARVLEQEQQDIDGAFEVLRKRLLLGHKDQSRIDEACKNILELCRKANRDDLGKRAYQLAVKANASNDLIRSFKKWAPETEESKKSSKQPVTGPEKPVEQAPPLPISDPRLTERLTWATARLTQVRNVTTYVNEVKAIEEFSKVVTEISPQESGRVVELIQSITNVIVAFSSSDPQQHDTRRVLYDRVIGFEKRLSQLLKSGALSNNLENSITPYHVALRQVVGDLSRQAGIGPVVHATIENPFISLEKNRSKIILRVTNGSDRLVTDIWVELLVESSLISINGKRDRLIGSLEAHQSQLLSFPFEKGRSTEADRQGAISFNISLRATAEGFPNVDLGITKRQVPVKLFRDVIGVDQIPKLFQVGQPLRPTDPDLFQGRNDILERIISSFYGGRQRERYFLDGIRRVGKTSILNFLPDSLPEELVPVLVNLEYFGLQGPIDSRLVLHQICTLISEKVLSSKGVTLEIPGDDMFKSMPGQAFSRFLTVFKTSLPDHIPFLMIDEFQLLLEAVARSGSEGERDTLVLDLLRGHLDEGNIYAILTGSVRFDRLSRIVNHRIFGSLTRLRVSFLSEESVSNVLNAGLQRWVTLPPETIHQVYELTGGYPWLVQTYGTELVDLLNQESRTIATPQDVDYITRENVLVNDELFAFWWPPDQLGSEEERFTEELLHKYAINTSVSTRIFFADIHSREQPAFRRAFENLRACEVLDSTETENMRFSGHVLRQWLEQQLQDGRLRIRNSLFETVSDRGRIGVFIDHENFIASLHRVNSSRISQAPSDKSAWFTQVLGHLMMEIEKRVGKPSYRVTVAFWSRPHEAVFLSAYFSHGFTPAQPVEIKAKNAVDFKVADEVRRAREQAMRENTWLSQAIIITGDGDLSHSVEALKHDGVNVQIWAGRNQINSKYAEIIGESNLVMLDDISGL